MSNIILCDKRGNEMGLSEYSRLDKPEAWLLDIFGGNTTSSGVRINRKTALSVSALWKGSMLICTAAAKSPLHIYSVDGDTRTVNKRHPAYSLLRYSPNNFQRAYDFRMMLTLDLILTGNAFAYIKWNGRGLPTEMIPLAPADVRPVYTKRGVFYDASIYYDDGGYELLPMLDSSQMLHLTWMPGSGIMGEGLLSNAHEILGQAVAMMRHAGSFFQNSARPDIVIKHPGKFKDPAARSIFREDWKRAYGGPAGQHGIAVLDEAMDIQLMGTNARDSQFVETWGQVVREVANFLGLPPSKLGDMSRSAYNSLEQDQLATVADCYDGFLVNWEEGLNEKILSTSEQRSGSATCAFDRSALLATDLKTQAEYLSKALGNNAAWVTPNEARARMGMNPTEGGDELPKSNEPMPSAGTTPEPAAPSPDVEEALSAVVEESVTRAVRRLFHDAAREHKQGGIALAVNSVSKQRELCTEMTTAATRAACVALGVTVIDAGKIVHNAVSAALVSAAIGPPEAFSDRLNATTDNTIKEIMGYVKADFARAA